MKRQLRTTLFWGFGILVVLGFLAISFVPMLIGEQEGGIVLPEQGDADVDIAVDMDAYNQKLVEELNVTPQTVQQLIQTLRRPSEYAYETTATFFAEEQNHVLRAQAWRKDDVSKTISYDAQGALQKQVILTPEEVYIWGEDSEESFFRGSAGDFTDEDTTHIPSHEQLLSLPVDAVRQAELQTYGSLPCIYVQTLDDDTNEQQDWYLSIAHGLVIGFSVSVQGQPVFSMDMSTLDLAPVDTTVFALPSGLNVWQQWTGQT